MFHRILILDNLFRFATKTRLDVGLWMGCVYYVPHYCCLFEKALCSTVSLGVLSVATGNWQIFICFKCWTKFWLDSWLQPCQHRFLKLCLSVCQLFICAECHPFRKVKLYRETEQFIYPVYGHTSWECSECWLPWIRVHVPICAQAIFLMLLLLCWPILLKPTTTAAAEHNLQLRLPQLLTTTTTTRRRVHGNGFPVQSLAQIICNEVLPNLCPRGRNDCWF